MYYRESIIDGVLHKQTSPDVDWEPFTLEELTLLYANCRSLLLEGLFPSPRPQISALTTEDGYRVLQENASTIIMEE